MKTIKSAFVIGLVLACLALIVLTTVLIIPFGTDHEQNLRIMEIGIRFQVIGLIAIIILGIASILNTIVKK